jgi:aminopeptidase-like protein
VKIRPEPNGPQETAVTRTGPDARLLDGAAMHALATELFPIPRSITGNGVRATLATIGEHVPLQLHEVASGTPVLDWTVPPEWNVQSARLTGPDGSVIADVERSTLALLGYSEPVEATVPLSELRAHLFSLPDRPDWTPYRTSYYRRAWGFCLPHRVLEALPDGDYHVHIVSTLDDGGSLTYGEVFVPGTTDDEILVSTHTCHPSLANDNLSGILVAAALAQRLLALGPRQLGVRFVFVPGTIGAITWLARNRDTVGRIRAGLVLTGLGDRGGFVYKRSRQGGTWTDRVVEHVLAERTEPHRVDDFSPYGYDERQYCSPGFDLPVGRLSRSAHGEYPEYHTSGDDLDFITADSLQGSLDLLTNIFDVFQTDAIYLNTSPYGEPQLGRRGLYRDVGASMNAKAHEMALLWVLGYSDGSHSLLDIAHRSGLPYAQIAAAVSALAEVDLLTKVS